MERKILLSKNGKHKSGAKTRCVSRLLCTEICFHGSVGGRQKVQVLCLHLHHNVAKRVSDEQKSQQFGNVLAEAASSRNAKGSRGFAAGSSKENSCQQ